MIAGDDQSPEVHALAHYINQHLENNGKTVVFTPSLGAEAGRPVGRIQALVNDLQCGPGGSAADPRRQSGVYKAPPALNLRGAIQRAKMRVRLGLYDDETSEVCQWVVPEAHAYEHWSDAPAYDGTVSII